MKILIPNIGSTSFKFRVLELLDDAPEAVLAQGRVERIGQPGSCCPDYPSAIHECLAAIAGPGKPLASLNEIDAVGFKAVHAGPLAEAQIIGGPQPALHRRHPGLPPAVARRAPGCRS